MRISTITRTVEPDFDLCTRIRAEFSEMPGLRLNLWQASRLFDIEPDTCERVFGLLVQDGVLRRRGELYARAMEDVASRC